jgi:hypothetical protein
VASSAALPDMSPLPFSRSVTSADAAVAVAAQNIVAAMTRLTLMEQLQRNAG